jgi:NADH-quinone oxidoreductase subunit L
VPEPTRNLAPLLGIIALLPLASAIIIACFGKRWLKERSHWPAVIGLGFAAFLSLVLLTEMKAPVKLDAYEWVSIGSMNIHISLQCDALSGMMLGMVTFISFLIAVFSIGYMHGDPGYPRFFACISLFVFCMLMLVLADNFVLLFIFWEGVGLCSYLLIGFWFQKPSAAAAARKAFLVNRIGDFGFLLGVFLIGATYHAMTYTEVFAHVDQAGRDTILTICLLLLLGAVGKSAQFPLHVWLPDAMEGPTPVSALIHAATMVTAGVYMVARCSPLFVRAEIAQVTIAILGGITALLAALIAVTQTDLKRVMAYSTVSQLGYMFMALGSAAGNPAWANFAVLAAMFHLFTHAFFKALLFLASGSVMHAMGNVIDMRRFSGLRKALPWTHATFLCGAAALAGVPLISGFWSKDEILASLERASGGTFGPTFEVLLWIAVFTAFLTAFYTFRAYFLTFWGAEKFPEEAGHHPHEAPPSMKWPLVILSVGALLVGAIFGPTHWFAHALTDPAKATVLKSPVEEVHVSSALLGISVAVVVAGIALAYGLYVWQRDVPAILARKLRAAYELSYQKFYLDELYSFFVVKPAQVLADLCKALDQYLVDGIVDLTGRTPMLLGQWTRPLQNGLVQWYSVVTLLGLAVFLLALLSQLG